MDAKPIIAGTDGSNDSLRAVEWAAREAALHGAPLRIVSVPEQGSWLALDLVGPETVSRSAHEAARRALAAAAERATAVAPDLRIDASLLSGSPGQALADATNDGAMLVVGSRGAGGFAALALGSVSRYAATHAPVPVVVAREESTTVQREVVVGIRDPEESAAALEFAFREASARKARLLAAHAWFWSFPAIGLPEVPGVQLQHMIDPHEMSVNASARLDAALTGWQQKYPGVQTGWEVVHAHPGRVLAGASARADLVVIGRHHEDRDVDSVTYAVLTHAHGPVACVPEPR
jgi:nucleotide-binding universal stress UspA family protein